MQKGPPLEERAFIDEPEKPDSKRLYPLKTVDSGLEASERVIIVFQKC